MKAKAKPGYTLELFAAAAYPVRIDTTGYDDPRPGGPYGRTNTWRAERSRKAFLRNYRAQCKWNDRMARVLAEETPWTERPVPVADWTPKGMKAYLRSQLASTWHKDTAALLDTDGRAYRLFATACRKAA